MPNGGNEKRPTKIVLPPTAPVGYMCRSLWIETDVWGNLPNSQHNFNFFGKHICKAKSQ